MKEKPLKRIKAVDVGRCLAAFAVVLIHCTPKCPLELDVFINQAARFAVPYFFIISGYFFGRKLLEKRESLFPLCAQSVKMLLLIYIAWLVIYILIPTNIEIIRNFGFQTAIIRQVDISYNSFIAHPWHFFLGGGELSGHLWFFPSLVMAQILLAIMVSVGVGGKVYYLILPLYLIVLITGSYADTPIGIRPSFYSRNGPFFSSSFVMLGYLIAVRNIKCRRLWVIVLIVGGYLFQLLEGYFLSTYYGKPMLSNRALVGTMFFSAGIALLAIQSKYPTRVSVLSSIGMRYALGIYAIHILILRFLMGVGFLRIPVVKYFTPFLVFVMALIFSMILTKWRVTKYIISGRSVSH